ncbi:MAG: D-alanyl-D-alanine carboxypeptidase/D-alanyl-D-alanine-endopeptidase [Gammaproteobacteria bacterium]|nr:D-alanyl-D-alanine carboxypeptidase/D-alanyl-D-alanine-endopeptidase [Gammaproteobacteria bacterium]NNC56284.1 D-alanyl-D-alanine carboxypeptidase/D-alanyl-D-alanine-endopeptidase [Woeseiaceae bacterium]
MKRTGILFLLWLVTGVAAHAAEAELPFGVRSVLELRQVPSDTLSIYVADVDTGKTVLQWLDGEPRNPASTIKLLTTLVALDILGPTYRWKTDVFALGEMQGEYLDGDLLLKGYGDPFLVTERVWQFLREIRFAGVREISGDLLIDDSYFDVGDYDPGAFDRQPLRAYNVAPNALLMNFKVVRYWFEPDHALNAVNVRLEPALDNLTVENQLGLASGRCRGYQRGITISTNELEDEVTFSGKFPNGCKRYAMDRAALSHNEFVYGLFRLLWRESGGEFDGGWKNVVAETESEPLVSFESLPLSEMIARVNKHSNNVMARQLLYTLSAEVNGEPGTEKGGRAVIANWLTDNGLESCKLALENGAGLSRNARITAADMGSLLTFAWRQPYMPEYVASMSISGLDGTLSRRFQGTDIIGKAHLKTGSMDDVSAVAGYLQSRSGRRYAVVAVQNHKDIHRGPGEEVQEALLRWVYEQ